MSPGPSTSQSQSPSPTTPAFPIIEDPSTRISSPTSPQMSHPAQDKLANYQLTESKCFDGTNYDRFKKAFLFMLDLSEKIYILDNIKYSAPSGANLARDKRTVYNALETNINDEAMGIISSHEGDGPAAWKAFTDHYGKVDVGTTISLASELGHLHWNGGDYDSFTTFLSRFEKLVNDLRGRKFVWEDWSIAMMLIGKIPLEFIRYKIELEEPSKLKTKDVVSLIQSSINLSETAKTQDALIARSSPVTTINRSECAHCRDVLKKPHPKFIHSSDRCYAQFPHYYEEDKKKREKAKKAKETAAVAEEATAAKDVDQVAYADHVDRCYITIDGGRKGSFLDWIVDTGCTTSVVPDARLLTSYVASKGTFMTIGDGSQLPIIGTGSFTFVGTDGNTHKINRVLHVPQMTSQLLSVRAFINKGASFLASGSSFSIVHGQGTAPLIQGTIKDGLYRCQLAQHDGISPHPEVSYLADTSLVHRRFGHVSLTKARGLPSVRVTDCDACIRGKFRRLPFNGEPPIVTEPLALIHADLWVTNQATHGGCKYMAVFTCAATHFTKVAFLKKKSDAYQQFVDFVTAMEKQTTHTVKQLMTDGGGEFDNGDMKAFCQRRGIASRTTIPYTSNQNGLAERRIGIILSDVRTLLIDSGLSPGNWDFAAAHAVYIRNRIPGIDGLSPHFKVFGKTPRLDHLRPFGCAAYIWIPDVHRTQKKLNPRSVKTIFMGFEAGTSNVQVYDPVSRTHFRSRDVRFLEDVFPAKGDETPDLSFLEGQWELEHLEDPVRNDNIDDQPDDDDDVAPLPLPNVPDPPAPAPAPRFFSHIEVPAARPQHIPPPKTKPPPRVFSHVEIPLRRPALHNNRPKQAAGPAFTNYRDTVFHDDTSEEESTQASDSEDDPGVAAEADNEAVFIAQEAGSTQAVLASDQADGWKASIAKELDSIQRAGVFELVDPKDIPRGTKAINSRFVHATKIDPSGGTDHVLKTRLVAKGFSQRPGIDYTETFSPVGHRQSLRQMLSIVAEQDLELQGLDISTAFLHGDLEEELYLRLPAGSMGALDGKVVRLRKSLYGLKQAGRCWNQKLDSWLKVEGWVPNDNDACLYTSLRKGHRLLFYVHVDDCAIAGSSVQVIQDFIDVLNATFPCKRQGDVQYFLGMEITRNRADKKLWITQHQYTLHKLEEFGLLECKANDVPIVPSAANKLQKGSNEEHQAAVNLPYRELTGSLQYLATMSRPDIAWAVSRMGSFNSCWTIGQFKLAKGILRYIAGTRDWGLCLGGTCGPLEGFVDADFNGCRDTYRSTTGWVVMYRGGTIAWKSKKQSVVAHSTAEAEYMALDDVARDLVWERRGLQLLGDVITGPTSINVDNQAALSLARNRTSHDSTKHIAYRYHYIRDLIDDKIMQPKYIDTNHNTSDILTKALARDRFLFHAKALGLSAPVKDSGSVRIGVLSVADKEM